MLYSIRWRLTASFTLLTLLTVTLLGILVLTLMERTLDRQASDYLKANAQAVASQSGLLFQPAPQTAQLHQLAQTAAFLADVQVRILDGEQKVLVDSGAPDAAEQFTWIIGDAGMPVPPGARPAGGIMVAPAVSARAVQPPPGAPGAPLDERPAVDVITVHKLPGPWGDQFFFRNRTVSSMTDALLITSALSLTSVPGVRVDLARSPLQVIAPIETGENVLGWVEMSSASDVVGAALAVIRQAFWVAAAVVTALSVALGLVVSRGLTAPLEGLAAATKRMNSGDLSARAPVHGKDEIGLLAGQFNQMAEALEQSFAALAAERDALRRFIADASHELRTPLTALRTFIDLLAGNTGAEPATQQEFLRESQGQVDRLERITSNLLNLSRLEGGLVPLVANHNLAALLQNVLGPLRAVAQERQIELQVTIPDDELTVACDALQLETALTNLVENAIKFTPTGGQVQVGASASEEGISIWVKDNGVGIPVDDLPYIFERFHRGRTANVEGSGLGLAIVQNIIQAHGGGVRVVSQEGVGSRFTISLPASAAPVETSPPPV